MVIKKHKPQGFIAIVSLLIISTVTMFFAFNMLSDGITNASLSFNSVYFEDARINMYVCLEDTLLRMKNESQFTTNLNYTISSDDSCVSNIQWGTPTQTSPGVLETPVTLNVTGTSNGYTRSFTYGLKVTQFDVNLLDGSLDYMNTIDILSIIET